MKIVVIKIEATHSNPNIAVPLEFAAVAFDTNKPWSPKAYHKRFKLPETFEGNLGALVMNAQLLTNALAFANNSLAPSEVELYDINPQSLFSDFFQWLADNKLLNLDESRTSPYFINVAGKN